MIKTIKPYGSISINEVKLVDYRFSSSENDFVPYVFDKYGGWQITKETYEELVKKGIPKYGRGV